MPDGFIYFIRSQCGKIKIGHALNPEQRLADMQTGCPTVLTIVGLMSGTRRQEKALHKRMAAARSRGEWFNDCPEISSLIDQNRYVPMTYEVPDSGNEADDVPEAYSVPPPQRNQVKPLLAAMTAETDLFFKGGSPNSIKAIASRLSVGKRRYVTAQQNGGVRVWRLT